MKNETKTKSNDNQSLIFSLYDAVSTDGAWDDFVQSLALQMDAHISIMVSIGPSTFEQSLYGNYNFNAAAVQAYSDHWWQHNVWLQTIGENNLLQKNNVMIGTDLVPADKLKQHTFYKDFLTPHLNVEHLLIAILSDGTDITEIPMSLNLFRPPSAPAFTQDDAKQLRELLPHINRAFKLHWQMRNMNEQLSNFHNGLDSLDFAVMYVDSARRVSHSNKAAQRIAKGVLLPQLPLQGDIANLIDRAALGQGGAAMINSLRTMVLALPISNPVRTSAGEMRSSVMLLLVGADDQHAAATTFLCNAFALSKAESRLIPLLLLGQSPTEMGTSLDLKLTTIRSQLSSIFAKTGTTRQQELIRLLGRVPAVVDQ